MQTEHSLETDVYNPSASDWSEEISLGKQKQMIHIDQ